MINLVWRTDVHMADRGPSSRKDDWTEMVFDKLSQVYQIALAIKARAIIDGGDFFNDKSPKNNSHELVRRCIEHHLAYEIPTYCNPGNHDAVYGDYAFLPQQPLGVLFSSGAFRRLYDEHEAVFVEDGFKVRVVGVPYHGRRYDLDRFRSIKKGDEDVLICVAHVLASLKGGSMFEGEDIVKYEDIVDTDPDVFCFGHWHKDQGVETLQAADGRSKQFVNVGSLTRGSLSQDNVQRRPACVEISCSPEGAKITVHRLQIKSPEEVFDVEARARQVRQQLEMDSFVSKIKQSLVRTDPDESLDETVKATENVPDEVRDRALHYLEQVR